MWWFKLILLSLVLLDSSHTWAVLPDSDAKLCVQSFNAFTPIYALRKRDRLKLIAEEFNSKPCNLIQIQELWTESYYDEFLEFLGIERSYQSYRGDHARNDGKITGLVTFYRDGIISDYHSELFKVNNLGNGTDDDIRKEFGVEKGFSVISNILEYKNDPIPLTSVNLHTHPLSPAIRIAQILQVIDYLWKNKTDLHANPIIINGDFNSTPETLEMDLFRNLLVLRDSFLDIHKTYEGFCTYCGTKNKYAAFFDKTDRFLDYVLFRSGRDFYLEPETSEINMLGTKELPLSDHYGVRTIFQFGKRTTEILPEDHPVVLERKERALASLRSALVVLKEQEVTHPEFQEITLNASAMISLLENKSLPETVNSLFRTF